MAASSRSLGGFANHNFVLLNDDFWDSSENRRYVQAHAGLAEFTQILLDWSPGNPNHKWTEWDDNTQQYRYPLLSMKGPLEILKFFENNSHYIASANPNNQSCLRQQMTKIRQIRNEITHNNIKINSAPLIDLLDRMEKVCK